MIKKKRKKKIMDKEGLGEIKGEAPFSNEERG